MDVVTGGLVGHVVMAALVALDSVLPLVPSEAVVIAASAIGGPAATLGVVASRGARVRSWATCSSTSSDAGPTAPASAAGWAADASSPAVAGGAGAAVVVWGRFVPGGRTCVSFLSGATGMRWRTYLPAAAAGSLLWAVYVTALGRIGSRFAVSTPVSIAIGIGLGLVVCPLIAVVAVRRRRRRADPSGQRQLAVAGRELATQDGRRGH